MGGSLAYYLMSFNIAACTYIFISKTTRIDAFIY